MPSSEFSHIMCDLSMLGESARIEVSKQGMRFVSDGQAANWNVLFCQLDGYISGTTIKPKTGQRWRGG
jgi:proliferating cell nuclear antigen